VGNNFCVFIYQSFYLINFFFSLTTNPQPNEREKKKKKKTEKL